MSDNLKKKPTPGIDVERLRTLSNEKFDKNTNIVRQKTKADQKNQAIANKSEIISPIHGRNVTKEFNTNFRTTKIYRADAEAASKKPTFASIEDYYNQRKKLEKELRYETSDVVYKTPNDKVKNQDKVTREILLEDLGPFRVHDETDSKN